MSKKIKKTIHLTVDALFQDRDHASVDIKNLTVREFSIIAYVFRSYLERYGIDGPDDSVGISIHNFSIMLNNAEKDIDDTLIHNVRGAYHG